MSSTYIILVLLLFCPYSCYLILLLMLLFHTKNQWFQISFTLSSNLSLLISYSTLYVGGAQIHNPTSLVLHHIPEVSCWTIFLYIQVKFSSYLILSFLTDYVAWFLSFLYNFELLSVLSNSALVYCLSLPSISFVCFFSNEVFVLNVVDTVYLTQRLYFVLGSQLLS